MTAISDSATTGPLPVESKISRLLAYRRLWLLATVVITLDQLTKYWISVRLPFGSYGPAGRAVIPGFFTDTWPWPEQTFDAVLAFNVLHLIVDRASTYARVHRLLRPGGLFITKTPCLGEMNPLIRLALPVARAIGKAPTVKVFRAKDIEQEIAAAGFTIVERARHGTARKDPRIFIFAQKQD